MIKLNDFAIQQGAFSLANINFEIPEGKYAVLMGRSGSGKTSILEAVCGLRQAHSGQIFVGRQEVTHLRPGERNIGYVPQDGALFPEMIVGEQLAFSMKVRKMAPKIITERVLEVAKMLGISHLLERTPEHLSGGEKQRVALGRALALKPAALCLDEPLSALDEATHDEICKLLTGTIKQQGITVLHITHNPSEAHLLADLSFHLDEELKEIKL